MSQRKTESNRINAKKSTGPKTDAGKAAIRQNAVKTGMYTKDAVLPSEDYAQFRELRQSWQDEHQPQTPTEEYLIESIVTAIWRRRRLQAAEVGLHDLQKCEQSQKLHEAFEVVTENAELANEMRVDFAGARMLSDMWRHDARLDRSIVRSLKELERLKGLRPKQPDTTGPQVEKEKSQNQSQTSPTETDSTTSEDESNPTSKLRASPADDGIQVIECDHKNFLSQYGIAFGGGLR